MEEIRKSFDEEWEIIHSNNEWGIYPTEQVIRFVARNYYKLDRKNVRILDFGCGGGAHTWYLAREGFDTYAFDGSKSAISKLKARLENEHLKADLRVLDGCQLDYQNDFFDAVVDNVCIYGTTLDNVKYMYQEVYNILKPGGKLLSTMFSTKTTGYGTGDLIEKNTYKNITEGRIAGRGTFHFYEDGEIEVILAEIGFKNIVVERMEYQDCGDFVSMYCVKCEK